MTPESHFDLWPPHSCTYHSQHTYNNNKFKYKIIFMIFILDHTYLWHLWITALGTIPLPSLQSSFLSCQYSRPQHPGCPMPDHPSDSGGTMTELGMVEPEDGFWTSPHCNCWHPWLLSIFPAWGSNLLADSLVPPPPHKMHSQTSLNAKDFLRCFSRARGAGESHEDSRIHDWESQEHPLLLLHTHSLDAEDFSPISKVRVFSTNPSYKI